MTFSTQHVQEDSDGVFRQKSTSYPDALADTLAEATRRGTTLIFEGDRRRINIHQGTTHDYVVRSFRNAPTSVRHVSYQ